MKIGFTGLLLLSLPLHCLAFDSIMAPRRRIDRRRSNPPSKRAKRVQEPSFSDSEDSIGNQSVDAAQVTPGPRPSDFNSLVNSVPAEQLQELISALQKRQSSNDDSTAATLATSTAASSMADCIVDNVSPLVLPDQEQLVNARDELMRANEELLDAFGNGVNRAALKESNLSNPHIKRQSRLMVLASKCLDIPSTMFDI